MAEENYKKILVIGAGLSGLTLAAHLLRNGIIPVIIDTDEGFIKEENFTIFSTFTLAGFNQLGIGENLQENLKPLNNIQIIGESQNVQIKLPEPFFTIDELFLKQQLLNYLTLHTCSVGWKTQLKSLTKTVNGQFEAVFNKDEKSTITVFDFVVFTNDDLTENQFFTADVKPKTAPKTDDLQLYISAKNSFFGLPFGDGRLKITGKLPKKRRNDIDIKKDILRDFLPDGFELLSYRFLGEKERDLLFLDDRHVFNTGRKSLVLNTLFSDESILNAQNLAWKLAGVAKGHQKARILQTYQPERQPHHQHHFNLKNQLLKALFGDDVSSKIIRKHFLISSVNASQKIKKQLGQINPANVNYRDSLLSLHLSQADRIKAGDQLPNLKFFDEKASEEIYLYNWFKKPGFTILILGTYNNQSLLAMARFVQLNYPYKLNLYYLPFSKRNKAVFKAFEIDDGRKKCLIIRPDLFIGLLSDLTDIEQIAQYFNDFAAFIPSKKTE